MDIQELLEKTISIKFEYEDRHKNKSSVSMEVLEESMTPEFFAPVRKFEKEQDASALATALSKVVKNWDIQLGGKDFPPTFDNLMRCPFSFLTELINAIAETWQGDAGKSKKSRNTSAQTE